MDENLNENKKSLGDKITLPVSIVIAGLLIAGGIYLNGKITKENPTPIQAQQAKSKDLSGIVRPIDANDHILGSPKARVLVIEYSDTECPYCKDFHATMNSIMQEYGKDGNVAWIYRHDPISALHSKSLKEAEATECAANLGGNSKFWEYINKLYEITPSNDNLDPKELTNIAKQVGLSSTAFDTCLNSGEFAPRVNADIQNAQEIGVAGTPYSVVIDTKSDQYYPIEGAYPYAQVKSVIDLILNS
ncbi:MAG: DsbA family protein [Candidatus Zambryskibacteria bacterium]